MAGVMRLFSKEYFTRNTIPKKRTKPPIHAKSLTARNASQSIAARAGRDAGGGFIGGGSPTGFLGNAGSGIDDRGGRGGATASDGEELGAI
jgi:hypothetical protein